MTCKETVIVKFRQAPIPLSGIGSDTVLMFPYTHTTTLIQPHPIRQHDVNLSSAKPHKPPSCDDNPAHTRPGELAQCCVHCRGHVQPLQSPPHQLVQLRGFQLCPPGLLSLYRNIRVDSLCLYLKKLKFNATALEIKQDFKGMTATVMVLFSTQM